MTPQDAQEHDAEIWCREASDELAIITWKRTIPDGPITYYVRFYAKDCLIPFDNMWHAMSCADTFRWAYRQGLTDAKKQIREKLEL